MGGRGSGRGECSEAEPRRAGGVTPELALDVTLEDLEDTTPGPHGTFRPQWTRACDQLSAFASSPVARIRTKAARILAANAAFAAGRYHEQAAPAAPRLAPLLAPAADLASAAAALTGGPSSSSPSSSSSSSEKEDPHSGQQTGGDTDEKGKDKDKEKEEEEEEEVEGHVSDGGEAEDESGYDDDDDVEHDDNLWAFCRLLPILCDLAHDLDPLVRCAAAETLRECTGALVPPGDARALAPAVQRIVVVSLLAVAALLASDDVEAVRAAATRTLVDVAGRVGAPVLRESVVPVLCRLAAHPHAAHGGGAEAAVLARTLAERAPRSLFVDAVLPRYLALAHSRAAAVRAACAEGLAAVAARLGPASAAETVAPLVAAHARDPVWSVRAACAAHLADLARALPAPARDTLVLGAARALLHDASRWVRTAAQAQYGLVLACVDPACVTAPVLADFTQLAADVPGARGACAYALPRVLAHLGAARFPELRSTLVALCADLQWDTRLVLAAALPGVAAAVLPAHPAFAPRVLALLAAFLRDLEEVRLAALRGLGGLVAALAPRHALRVLRWVPELATDDNWRVRRRVARALPALVRYVQPRTALLAQLQGPPRRPSSSAASSGDASKRRRRGRPEPPLTAAALADIGTQLCDDGVWAVRHAAAGALADTLAALDDADTRSTLASTLVARLAQAPVYSQRILFVNLCDAARTALGRAAFDASPLAPALAALEHDPVALVRRAWARLQENPAAPTGDVSSSSAPAP